MKSRTCRVIALALGLVVLTATAGAVHFTVTLANGTTLETRYRPTPAEWDPAVTLLLTDQGNWIALDGDEIAEVVLRRDESGFGHRLDTTTLFVGLSSIDLVAEEGAEGLRPDLPEAAGTDYSIEPFLTTRGVSPSDTTSEGIPLFTLLRPSQDNEWVDTFTDRYIDFDDLLGAFAGDHVEAFTTGGFQVEGAASGDEE